MNTQYRMECIILNTILDLSASGLKKEKPFKLDLEAFSYPFNKRVAEKINCFLDESKTPYLLGFLIEEQVENTKYEKDWLEIISSTITTIKEAKDFHDNLIVRKFERKRNVKH